MISVAFRIDFPVCVVKECQYIHRPVTDIFKLLQAFFRCFGLQVWKQSFEDLNTWALVKEKEVPGRVHVQTHQMFHLGKKIRVGDVKKVAALVWLKMILFKYALNR